MRGRMACEQQRSSLTTHWTRQRSIQDARTRQQQRRTLPSSPSPLHVDFVDAHLVVTLAGCTGQRLQGSSVYVGSKSKHAIREHDNHRRRLFDCRADLACFVDIHHRLQPGLDRYTVSAMDSANENQTFAKPSGLKPPSKLPSLLKEDPTSPTSIPRATGLSELTDAMRNSRGAMGPPSYGSIKHKPSGLPEPESKQRKTLAERAVEPFGSKIAAPQSSRSINGTVKNTGSNGSRGLSNSLSRSTSTRPPKHKTMSSSSSLGHNSRAVSAQPARPKSSYGSHNRSRSQYQRPATSMAQHDPQPEPQVFDDTRVASLEAQFAAWKEQMEADMDKQSKVQESIELYKTKNAALEDSCTEYKRLLEEYKTNVADLKSLNSTISMELENVKRSHSYEVDDLRRKYQNHMQDAFDRSKRDLERAREENQDLAEKIERELKAEIESLHKSHKEELETLERRLKAELEEERGNRQRERQDVLKEFDSELRNARLEADTKERENQLLQGELTNTKAELDRERLLKSALQGQLTDATTTTLRLEASNKAMKEKIDFLESDSQAQSSAFNELHRRMEEAFAVAEAAQEKLRQEETLRRKLHNQVQELKGNIRVMCRVRPAHDSETDPAKIGFPDADTDSKEVAVQGPEKISAMGTNITQTYSYTFDRVFSPGSQNAEVFEEISQLVQSALDGYNVCIFCYGQTGSGKTFTMSSADGMIPRATAQIYAEATRLQEKGWQYKMEGSFVEVYNETYNDLLGRSEDLDKKKIEVRHDPAKKQTTLENAVSVALDGPHRVEEILQRADKNRTVAATKANMRSSRSHSVFILKLVGENSVTGERSEGTLNLVDLAGSERLDHSKAEGARLKETQNINKSLSCLGDVINALGSSKENSHIPYRNSRLTYLLQYSLGGNSKTLMFVMASPLQAHLQETITSLKFATKVHNTHIGTAKKQTKASG
ncbi:hypothetical protein PMIN03_007726 [Paraphaeosphaeria minitans]